MEQEAKRMDEEEDDDDKTEPWRFQPSSQSTILKPYDEESALEATMSELVRTKEEIKRARESSTQSWLDSRPLMDELNELQSDLAKTKNRVAMSSIAVSAFQSQLKSSIASIRSAREEEFKARTALDQMHPLLDQTRIEVDKLKLELEEERRAQHKMKQELHLQKLNLQTIQLTQRAARKESKALEASTAAALHHIKYSKKDNSMIELSHEDYYKLMRKANEEAALAELRVSTSMEQKQTAEISRDKTFRRLNELYKKDGSRKDNLQPNIATEEEEIVSASIATQNPSVRMKENTRHRPVDNELPQRSMKRSKSKNKKMVRKKKSSILHQIYGFLVRNINRFFG